jgi:hypothetical protein
MTSRSAISISRIRYYEVLPGPTSQPIFGVTLVFLQLQIGSVPSWYAWHSRHQPIAKSVMILDRARQPRDFAHCRRLSCWRRHKDATNSSSRCFIWHWELRVYWNELPAVKGTHTWCSRIMMHSSAGWGEGDAMNSRFIIYLTKWVRIWDASENQFNDIPISVPSDSGLPKVPVRTRMEPVQRFTALCDGSTCIPQYKDILSSE